MIPFDDESIAEALIKSGGVPGKMLTLLHDAIEKAIQEGKESVDRSFIATIFEQKKKLEPINKENILKEESNRPEPPKGYFDDLKLA